MSTTDTKRQRRPNNSEKNNELTGPDEAVANVKKLKRTRTVPAISKTKLKNLTNGLIPALSSTLGLNNVTVKPKKPAAAKKKVENKKNETAAKRQPRKVVKKTENQAENKPSTKITVRQTKKNNNPKTTKVEQPIKRIKAEHGLSSSVESLVSTFNSLYKMDIETNMIEAKNKTENKIIPEKKHDENKENVKKTKIPAPKKHVNFEDGIKMPKKVSIRQPKQNNNLTNPAKLEENEKKLTRPKKALVKPEELVKSDSKVKPLNKTKTAKVKTEESIKNSVTKSTNVPIKRHGNEKKTTDAKKTETKSEKKTEAVNLNSDANIVDLIKSIKVKPKKPLDKSKVKLEKSVNKIEMNNVTIRDYKKETVIIKEEPKEPINSNSDRNVMDMISSIKVKPKQELDKSKDKNKSKLVNSLVTERNAVKCKKPLVIPEPESKILNAPLKKENPCNSSKIKKSKKSKHDKHENRKYKKDAAMVKVLSKMSKYFSHEANNLLNGDSTLTESDFDCSSECDSSCSCECHDSSSDSSKCNCWQCQMEDSSSAEDDEVPACRSNLGYF